MSLLSALGAGMDATSKQKQGTAQMGLDTFNIGAANAMASDALQRGATQAGLAKSRGSAIIGKQQAGYAASGVDSTTGSPIDAMIDTRMMASLDSKTIMNNAVREAWGYKIKGIGYGIDRQLTSMKTADSMRSDVLSAGSAGLKDPEGIGSLLGG